MKYLKKLYGTTIIDSSDSENFKKDYKIELEYYQIKSSTSNKPYGIEIVKRNIKNNQMNIENKIIRNIHDKEQDTNKLLEILISNKVTPISVEEIIQDLSKAKTI